MNISSVFRACYCNLLMQYNYTQVLTLLNFFVLLTQNRHLLCTIVLRSIITYFQSLGSENLIEYKFHDNISDHKDFLNLLAFLGFSAWQYNVLPTIQNLSEAVIEGYFQSLGSENLIEYKFHDNISDHKDFLNLLAFLGFSAWQYNVLPTIQNLSEAVIEGVQVSVDAL